VGYIFYTFGVQSLFKKDLKKMVGNVTTL